MRLPAVLAIATAACAAPTIEMQLAPAEELAADFSTACVGAVLVQLDGRNIDRDPGDNVRECLDIVEAERRPTFAEMRSVLAGRFSSSLPANGLSAVEVYGFNGNCMQNDRALTDLVFYGFSRYVDGDEQVTIPVTANLDCVRAPVTAKVIDILKLETDGCTQPAFPRAKGIALSTFTPLPFGAGVDWWGGSTSALIDEATGIATFDAATEVAAGSCLVASYTNSGLKPLSTSCITPPGQNVCLEQTQREVAVIDEGIWERTRDETKFNALKGMVIGIAYNATGPLADVTITLRPEDAERAQVVYLQRGEVDGAIVLSPAPTQLKTDASGLFAIYTRSLIVVDFARGTTKVTRKVGTAGIDPITESTYSAAMIVRL